MMDIEKVKAHLMYEVLPGYTKTVGPCFTHQTLQKVTQVLLSQVVNLVFPDYKVVLKGIDDPENQIKLGKVH
jgi:hypothetical protein